MNSKNTHIQLTIPEGDIPNPPGTGTVQIGGVTVGQEVYFGTITAVILVLGYLIFVLWRKRKQGSGKSEPKK
jgi:H+/gluconate symporter-like permease